MELTSELLCSVDRGVATLVLNRPEARNAVSTTLRFSLRDEVRRLDADPAVRAIILTGSDPAFCAGFDMKELNLRTGVEGEVAPLVGYEDRPTTAPFITSVTPLIGAINGPAYTGGLELALACHLLIASDRATFADTHASLGRMPGWGLTVLLSEAVGIRRAREMSFSAQPIDAQVALDWGLVNRVVPHAGLLGAANDLAFAIAEIEPRAVRRVARLYDDQAAVRDAAAWRLEARAWLGSEPPAGSASLP